MQIGQISGTIQFVSLALGKTFILSKASPWECSCRQIQTIRTSIVFILWTPFEQQTSALSRLKLSHRSVLIRVANFHFLDEILTCTHMDLDILLSIFLIQLTFSQCITPVPDTNSFLYDTDRQLDTCRHFHIPKMQSRPYWTDSKYTSHDSFLYFRYAVRSPQCTVCSPQFAACSAQSAVKYLVYKYYIFTCIRQLEPRQYKSSSTLRNTGTLRSPLNSRVF